MEKRYYYTDPLAAAWMAKHFGLRFIENFEVSEQYIDAKLTTHTFPAKLHIHPDSLHVLELRDSDILEGCKVEIKRFWFNKISGESRENISEGEWMNEEWQEYYKEIKRNPGRIIHRDGKPFHWPEVEQQ